ncbi:MAG: TRAP transporter small permease [Flavobacteriaceae bacterium]|nr:TRAP transporter small permease [Flavobacteriaceae bacterium]
MKIPKLRKLVDRIVETTLVTLLILMIINVSYQVFTRYFTDNPSSFTEELSRYLMVWLGILGAGYVAGRNEHIAIDFFIRKLSPKIKYIVYQLIRWSIISFAVFGFIIGGGNLVFITFTLKQYSPSLGIPLGLVYLIIPFSGLLIVYYKLSTKNSPR